MADPSTRKLTITLPADLVAVGQTPILTLDIVADDAVGGKGSGKRAIQRSYRDANASDVGRIRRVEWHYGGPYGAIGASLLSSSQRLGIDFVQNLESRWDERLISSIAQTAVTLSGDDPPGVGSYFGTSYFGSTLGVPTYFGAADIGGQDVVVFDEQEGYLFAERGAVSTQIEMLSTPWSVINSVVLGAGIRDSTHWRGNVYLAMGPTLPQQRRYSVSGAGAFYENTVSTSPAGNVYSSAIKRGSDRAWYVDAAEGGLTFNWVGYTLDAFANLASPFQVGDPDIGVNGIGAFGPLTDFGSEDNIYSFTDQGKPVPLSKAMDALHSAMNGSQFADPGFGWNYYLSVMGLRALNLQGDDNPVGIGERMRGFTGHNGICTAIFAARGELWCVYLTSAGDLYGYRGVFGPETAETGQPLFFPWFYDGASTCTAIFSSTTPNPGTQNVTMIRADGTDLTHMQIAANGRDDLAATAYSVAGGTAYLTTFDKDPNLLKTLRLVRLQTRGLESGSSWAVSMGFDTSPIAPTTATYTAIGTVATNGYKTTQPVLAGIPLDNISGRTIKPRLVQVAAGASAATTPPELRGTLEIEYDERPDQIEEIHVIVKLDMTSPSDNAVWDRLRQLVGSQVYNPFKLQLPDDLPPGVSAASGGGQKYGFLQSVTARTDVVGELEAVELAFECWPEAQALTP